MILRNKKNLLIENIIINVRIFEFKYVFIYKLKNNYKIILSIKKNDGYYKKLLKQKKLNKLKTPCLKVTGKNSKVLAQVFLIGLAIANWLKRRKT